MKEKTGLKDSNRKSTGPDAGGTGSTFGLAGGAIVGGALGSLAGPGGTVAGALVGAAAGGAAGHLIGAGGWAEPREKFWRSNYRQAPFYEEGFDYEDYAEALRMGDEWSTNSHGRNFEESEPILKAKWEESKGSSRLDWEQARKAVRAAWNRARRADAG